MPSDYQWKPIEDLSPEWPALTDSELPAIRQVYEDLQALDPVATARWEVASHREWAIETGRVEDVYRWDRGTTETLMSKGIIADLIPRKGNDLEPEQIAAIIHDAQAVLEGLFEFVKGDRPLSKSYIHELHQALLKNVHTYRVTDDQGVVVEQKLEKGVYKRWPNSVKVNDGTHAYCPPEHVESEMDRLIEWHRRHVMDEVAPEVEAAWLHHRFTQIHPYPDGNGRVARALATVVLIKAGHFPLKIQTEERSLYCDALLIADQGDLAPFVQRIRSFQGRNLEFLSQLVQLRAGPETDHISSVNAAIEAIRLDLLNRGQIQPPAWSQTPARVSALRSQCFARLHAAVRDLRSALGEQFNFSVKNPRNSDSAVTTNLYFSQDDFPHISFRFATAGKLNRGIAQCAVFWVDNNDEKPTGQSRFLITYAESEATQQRRFEKWMEFGIVDGLQKWRATLAP